MPAENLSGLTIAITADRRAEEQAELLRRRGARVVHGPAVRTLPLRPEGGLQDAIAEVIRYPPELVALTTALGTRAWFEVADSLDMGAALYAALEGAEVLVRGPKAHGAALTAGLVVGWQTPTARSAELVEHLAEVGVRGRRVAVQLDGRDQPVLGEQIRALGADVIDVPVYRWTFPADTSPVRRLVDAVCDGRVDAVTFTSSAALWNLARLAEEWGVMDELRSSFAESVLAVCVGPVSVETARDLGFSPRVQPQKPRLGAMVQALCDHVRSNRSWTSVDGVRIGMSASAIIVGGEVVELPPLERDLLTALARRPGAVVSKRQLARSAWPGDADDHTVEVAVARLRRRLGERTKKVLSIETVPRRGYRLVASELPPDDAAPEALPPEVLPVDDLPVEELPV